MSDTLNPEVTGAQLVQEVFQQKGVSYSALKSDDLHRLNNMLFDFVLFSTRAYEDQHVLLIVQYEYSFRRQLNRFADELLQTKT